MCGGCGVGVVGAGGAYVGVAYPFGGPGGAVDGVDLGSEELAEFVGALGVFGGVPAYGANPLCKGLADEIAAGGWGCAWQDVDGVGFVVGEVFPGGFAAWDCVGAAFHLPAFAEFDAQECAAGLLEEPGPLKGGGFAGAKAEAIGEEIAEIERGILLGKGCGGGVSGLDEFLRRALIGLGDTFGAGEP